MFIISGGCWKQKSGLGDEKASGWGDGKLNTMMGRNKNRDGQDKKGSSSLQMFKQT